MRPARHRGDDQGAPERRADRDDAGDAPGRDQPRPGGLHRGALDAVQRRQDRQHLPALLQLGGPARADARLRRARSTPSSGRSSGTRRLGYLPDDRIGQAGIESAYDQYLHGSPGTGAGDRGLDRPAGSASPCRRGRPRRARPSGSRSTASSSARPRRRSWTASSSRSRRRTAGQPTAARSWPWTRTPVRSSRSRRTRPTSRASGSIRRRTGSSRCQNQKAAEAAELPRPQPRPRRDLPARLDVEARHRARGARAADHQPLRHAALLAQLLAAEPVRRAAAGVQELEPVRQPVDGHADGARAVLRHLLLPTGLRLLQPARERRPAAPGVGEALRVRLPDGRRRRPGGERPRPDDRVAEEDVQDARSTGPGSRATRSSSRSARRTSRSRRSSSRVSTR